MNTTAVEGIYISAKHQNIQPLKDAIIQSLALQPSDYTTPSFYNTRQLALLRSIREHSLHAHQDAEMFMTMDIVSSSLQLAYQDIVILLGLEGKVDLGTEIFSRFCVGK
jgi:tRNA U34 5-carboxymethylaminomethyl modifying GTPase MnmE/TrmE